MWDDDSHPEVPSLKQLRSGLADFIERNDRRRDFTFELREMGLLDWPEQGGNVVLTPSGHELYKREMVELSESTDLWAKAVASWRPTSIVLDTFQGRSRISTVQIGSALSLHGESEYGAPVQAKRIGALLCDVKLATKNAGKYTFPASHETRARLRTTITPAAPFGNRVALSQLFESMGPDICWYERHGTNRHLTTLYENLNQGQHQSVRLLFSKINGSKEAFVEAVQALSLELETSREIKIEVRKLKGCDGPNPHDRYLGDGSTWWNVPPINTWLGRGDHSDLSRIAACPFDEWWRQAEAVLD